MQRSSLSSGPQTLSHPLLQQLCPLSPTAPPWARQTTWVPLSRENRGLCGVLAPATVPPAPPAPERAASTFSHLRPAVPCPSPPGPHPPSPSSDFSVSAGSFSSAQNNSQLLPTHHLCLHLSLFSSRGWLLHQALPTPAPLLSSPTPSPIWLPESSQDLACPLTFLGASDVDRSLSGTTAGDPRAGCNLPFPGNVWDPMRFTRDTGIVLPAEDLINSPQAAQPNTEVLFKSNPSTRPGSCQCGPPPPGPPPHNPPASFFFLNTPSLSPLPTGLLLPRPISGCPSWSPSRPSGNCSLPGRRHRGVPWGPCQGLSLGRVRDDPLPFFCKSVSPGSLPVSGHLLLTFSSSYSLGPKPLRLLPSPPSLYSHFRGPFF